VEPEELVPEDELVPDDEVVPDESVLGVVVGEESVSLLESVSPVVVPESPLLDAAAAFLAVAGLESPIAVATTTVATRPATPPTTVDRRRARGTSTAVPPPRERPRRSRRAKRTRPAESAAMTPAMRS